MAEHPTQPEMLADLHESQQALLTFLDQVDDTTLYRRFIAEEWTLAENLVHVAEARQFFTGEVRKVLATPGAIIGHDQAHIKQVKTLLAQHRGGACTSEQQNS